MVSDKEDGFPISYFKIHFSTISSTCFWQNGYPIQALIFFFFLRGPLVLIPPAFSRLSLTGIKGHPSDSRRVSLGPSAEGGGGLKHGLCGFRGMKGGQKTLCDITAELPPGPRAPQLSHLCIPVLSADVIPTQGHPSPSQNSKSGEGCCPQCLWERIF